MKTSEVTVKQKVTELSESLTCAYNTDLLRDSDLLKAYTLDIVYVIFIVLLPNQSIHGEH